MRIRSISLFTIISLNTLFEDYRYADPAYKLSRKIKFTSLVVSCLLILLFIKSLLGLVFVFFTIILLAFGKLNITSRVQNIIHLSLLFSIVALLIVLLYDARILLSDSSSPFMRLLSPSDESVDGRLVVDQQLLDRVNLLGFGPGIFRLSSIYSDQFHNAFIKNSLYWGFPFLVYIAAYLLFVLNQIKAVIVSQRILYLLFVTILLSQNGSVFTADKIFILLIATSALFIMDKSVAFVGTMPSRSLSF